jgi:signal peptidase I
VCLKWPSYYRGGICTAKNPVLKEVLDWGIHILIAVLVGVLIVTFVGQRTVVNGSSMEPTLQDGDQLIIEKISPKLGKLHQGDIVTLDVKDFKDVPESPIIKRIIGVEGDTVEIKDGKVYVNGIELKEDYINGINTDVVQEKFAKVTVPKGSVYVMGDNRLPRQSLDSRTIGPLEISRIGGKAILRFYPFSSFGTLE